MVEEEKEDVEQRPVQPGADVVVVVGRGDTERSAGCIQ